MKFFALALMTLMALPVLAQDGVPDLPHSETWISYDGPGTPTVMVQPNGQGSTFMEAQLEDGTVVEAVVYLRVLDWNDNPVSNYPREDMWLESWDAGLVPCYWSEGTQADVNTDSNGLTFWVAPLHAGGYSQALTAVMLNGDNVSYEGGLNLNFNSPDINGDGLVNIPDLALFAQNLFGDYDFRSDLYRDGVINLSDVGRFTLGLGSACP